MRFSVAENAKAFVELLGERIRLLSEDVEQSDETQVPGGKPRISYKTMGFREFQSVTVTSPSEVAAAGESYVVYAIKTVTNAADALG